MAHITGTPGPVASPSPSPCAYRSATALGISSEVIPQREVPKPRGGVGVEGILENQTGDISSYCNGSIT